MLPLELACACASFFSATSASLTCAIKLSDSVICLRVLSSFAFAAANSSSPAVSSLRAIKPSATSWRSCSSFFVSRSDFLFLKLHHFLRTGLIFFGRRDQLGTCLRNLINRGWFRFAGGLSRTPRLARSRANTAIRRRRNLGVIMLNM